MTTHARNTGADTVHRDDDRHDDRHDDRGAALIMAIAFVVMIGAIGAGLASLVTSSVNNRGTLESVRNRQYAADAAIEVAIAEVRAAASTGADACDAISGVAHPAVINGSEIRVDWQSACGVIRGAADDAQGIVLVQRDVIFAACLDTGAECTDETIIIRAQVNFEQAASGAVTKTYVQSWSVNQ